MLKIASFAATCANQGFLYGPSGLFNKQALVKGILYASC